MSVIINIVVVNINKKPKPLYMTYISSTLHLSSFGKNMFIEI
jgi:hypothetical protein